MSRETTSPDGTAPAIRRLDRVAIALSAVCLAHCLALPVAVAATPALTSLLPGDVWVHRLILATALPLASVALWRGWRTHGDRLPAAIGVTGLLLLAAGVAIDGSLAETMLTVAGALVLAVAHLRNWRAVHRGHRH